MSTVDSEDMVPEDITMSRGPVWVLISVPSTSMQGDGFNVELEVGPALDVESLRALLTKTVEAL